MEKQDINLEEVTKKSFKEMLVENGFNVQDIEKNTGKELGDIFLQHERNPFVKEKINSYCFPIIAKTLSQYVDSYGAITKPEVTKTIKEMIVESGYIRADEVKENVIGANMLYIKDEAFTKSLAKHKIKQISIREFLKEKNVNINRDITNRQETVYYKNKENAKKYIINYLAVKS